MPRSRYDDDSDLENRLRRRPRRRAARKRADSNLAVVVTVVTVGLLMLVGAGVAVYLVISSKAVVGPGGGPPVGPVAGEPATDLERLAGAWECTFRDPAGNITMHKVKEIVGNTETATWYQPNGLVFRKNQNQFQLGTRDGDKVFRYFNGVVLVGPDAGGVFPGGEYVYTLEGDTWTEFVPGGGTIVWKKRR